MTDFITNLQTELTAAKLWAGIGDAAPLIGAMAVFAFSLYVLRRVIKRASRGKGGF